MSLTPRSRTRSGRSPGVFSRSLRVTALACLIANPETVIAASITWTGKGGNNLIPTAGNWSPATAPGSGDVLFFAGIASLNPQLTTGLAINSLAFNSGAGSFVLSGAGRYTISTAAGIANNSSNLQTINNAISLGGTKTQTWTAATGSLAIGGSVDQNGKNLIISGGSDILISGILSGGGSLTKNDSGTLTLGGNNSRTGVINLSAGTLLVTSDTALGTTVAKLNLKGGTFTTSGGARTFANVAKLSANSTISSETGTTFTKNFNNLGDHTLTVSGAGTLTLAGRVSLSNSSTARTLTLAGSGPVVISSAIINGNKANSGNIIKSGTATLTFSGATKNTYAGSTTVTGGTLLLAKSDVTAIAGALIIGDSSGTDTVRLLGDNQIADTSALTFNSAGVLEMNGFSDTVGSLSGGGKIDLGTGALTLAGDATTVFSGQLTGPGSLEKQGSGTLTLSGTSNSFGELRIESGAVTLGAAGAISAATNVTVTGASSVLSSGNFTNTAGTLVLEGGSVTTGSGTLVLAGGVTATSLDATSATITGKLSLGSADRTFEVAAGGVAATDLAISAAISGTAGFVKSGDGILLLSGINTFSGPTTINAGTLRVSGGSALSDSAALVISGGIFDLATSETVGSLAGSGSITLTSGTLTTGGNYASTTFSGTISGSGSIAKSGSGVLTIAGMSAYTGATAINAGTLRAGADGALAENSAFTISTDAALDLANRAAAIGSLAGSGNVILGTGFLNAGANGGTTTFSGAISGSSGSLVKTGAGTLMLSGNNTPGGAVTVSGGILKLTGDAGRISSASSISLETGGTLALDNSATNYSDRLVSSTSIFLNGGTLAFTANSAGSAESLGSLNLGSGSSTVSIAGNGILNFASLGTLAPGGTVSFSATPGTLGSGAAAPQVKIGGLATGFIGGWATVGSDFAEYSDYGVRAITGYYTGDLGINVNDANQIPILAASSDPGAKILTNAGVTTDKALNLKDVATVSLGDSVTRTLNLASGGLVKGTDTATTISGAGRLTAGGSSAGTLAVTTANGSALTISSSIINNAGGVVALSKAGSGTLTLSGANTYTGGNTLNEGTLVISAENNLGAASNGIVFNGGTLKITTGFAANSAKILTVNSGLAGFLEIAAGHTLTLANSANRLVSGNSASALFLTGPGTLVLQNANTAFTGTVQANAGNLELRDARSLGGAIVLAGGNLKLATAASTAFSNNLKTTANAAIDLGAATGFAHSLGNLSIGATTLTVTGGSGSSLAFGATTLSGNATFEATTGLSPGAVSGAFGITKTGTGSLTLAAPSTYTGATSISVGTLKIAAANATSATSALALAAGTTLDLANFSTATGSLAGTGNVTLGNGILTTGGNDASSTYSGMISGTGGFTKSGSGTLTLSGANTYSGTTAITRGILQISASERISNSSAVAISSGATLALANFNETIGSLAGSGSVVLGSGNLTAGANGASTTFSGIVAGTGQFVKSGAGTLTLTGINTFAGATTISAGVLNVRNAAAFGATAGGVTISSGAALELQGNVAIGAEALTLNGSGISGAGALRGISGDNSWAGDLSLATATSISADAGSLTIGGAISNGSHLLTLSGTGLTQLDGVLGGSGGLTKSGPGISILGNANTYTGITLVAGGTLVLQHSDAVSASTVSVSSGATLQLDDEAGIIFAKRSLTLNGSGIASSGALSSSSGENKWTGAISLASDSTVAVLDDSLNLSGAISGAGGLSKSGSGDLTLSNANTYTGVTDVSEGALVLTGSLASNTIIVASGASLTASGAISTATALTANGSVELTGGARSIASLNGSGSLAIDGALTIGSGNFSGILTDAVSDSGPLAKSAGTSLTKSTGGVLTLSGANYYTGATQILAGTLQLFGNHATNSVTIASGATFTGSGSVAGSMNYDSGSIFQWNIASGEGNGTYDKFTAGSLSGSGAIFHIVLGSGTFGDAFWDTPRTWTDVLTTQSGATLASVFTGGFSGSVPANGAVPSQGSFSVSGNNISWSAVPEPTGALAAVLLAAGLLRRRR